MVNLTDFAALDDNQKKYYAASVIVAGRDRSFFMSENGFIGKGIADATKPIHLVDKLTKGTGGTRCVMPMVLDLDGDGIVDDNQMEGNEEPIETDALNLEVSQLRNGVKSKGKLSEQETVIQFRATAKEQLGNWKAQKTDELAFLTLSGVAFTNKLDGTSRAATSQFPQLRFAGDISAPTTNRAIYAGTATSIGSLTVADKMSWSLLVKAHTLAKIRNIKPIRIGSKEYFVVVMSPEQNGDLKNDPDYKGALARAEQRGKNNPLFTGAQVTVDGMMIYEHRKVYSTRGAASGSKWGAALTVDGAQALLIGAQAMAYAHIGSAEWAESDSTDYKNRQGIAYSCMVGMRKAIFKSIYDRDAAGNKTRQDFSVISIYTAMSPIA
jgi:N4-gp56 family major capsid protein